MAGLLAAIPIGIATNLLTPRVTRWYASWDEGQRERSAAAEIARNERAVAYAAEPHLLTQVLLGTVLFAIRSSLLVLALLVLVVATLQFLAADAQGRISTIN